MAKRVRLFRGDCIEAMKVLDPNSIDSLITDPPAGISFMGKAWDDDKGGRKQWITWMTSVMVEAMRVMKPGAHGLVWAIPRTSHWTATALEDAGFEIRDVVTHLFGSGFPKSLDVSKAIDKAAGAEREVVGRKADPRYLSPANETSGSPMGHCAPRKNSEVNYAKAGFVTAPATDDAKKWQGFGTALKPAAEFWILIRKPCSEKTVAANVLKWGCGAINIDASRIEISKSDPNHRKPSVGYSGGSIFGIGGHPNESLSAKGRFPANLVLDEDAAAMLDEQSGILLGRGNVNDSVQSDNGMFGNGIIRNSKGLGKTSPGGASRFFYVAKASKADKGAKNTHPTVKSTKLMSYLITLIIPPGGTVLDPFAGSGSTGVAALKLKFRFIGIEQNEEYMMIIKKRLKAVLHGR